MLDSEYQKVRNIGAFVKKNIFYPPRQLCLAGERQAQEEAPQGFCNSYFRRRPIVLILEEDFTVTCHSLAGITGVAAKGIKNEQKTKFC